MICKNCHYENPDNAAYCSRCGSALGNVKKTGTDMSSILLIVWIACIVVISLISYVFHHNFYNSGGDKTSMIISCAINVIHNFTLVLPAIAIKHKTLRAIGISVTVLLAIWFIWQNIENTINMLEMYERWG